jgi:carboxyl-terminal processing protease
VAALAIGLVALAACSTAPKAPPAAVAPPSPPVSPEVALATFDAVWTAVDEQHFDPAHNGVDWAAVRTELRPQVAAVSDQAELRLLLERMLGRLGQSHFGIIPGEVAEPTAAAASVTVAEAAAPGAAIAPPAPGAAATADVVLGEEGSIGVAFRLVDGAIVAVGLEAGGPAAQAGVQNGWILREANGRPIAPPAGAAFAADGKPMLRYLAESEAAAAFTAEAGATAVLVFETAAGQRQTVRLVAERLEGESVKFGNLPPLNTRVTDRTVGSDELARAGVDTSRTAPTIGLIAFNIWMVPAMRPLDAAIDRHRSADGLIIDLRGNPGGVGAMAMGVAGHLVAEQVSLGRMTGRSGDLEFRVSPRRATLDGRIVEPFAGPIAILVDPLSASTSEIFAAGLQEVGRAKVFGQVSAGAALPSIAVSLPNGDVLQFAIADFVTPAGNRIEGRGVVPDFAVPLSIARIRAEGDPTLAAALRWLAEQAGQRPDPTS